MALKSSGVDVLAKDSPVSSRMKSRRAREPTTAGNLQCDSTWKADCVAQTVIMFCLRKSELEGIVKGSSLQKLLPGKTCLGA